MSGHVQRQKTAIWLLTALTVVLFVGCGTENDVGVSSSTDRSTVQLSSQELGTRLIPSDVAAFSLAEQLKWIKKLPGEELFRYGFIANSAANPATDACNVEKTEELLDAYYAALLARKLDTVDAPWEQLEQMAEWEQADMHASYEDSLGEPTQIGIIEFSPPSGPAYGLRFENSGEGDGHPLAFHTTSYNLHRANGDGAGALLAWTNTGGSLRTSGVDIPSYSGNTIKGLQLECAFTYSDYDYYRHVKFPVSQTFTQENCDYYEGPVCTANSLYSTNNGFVWRPGCVTGQCSYPEDLELCTDNWKCYPMSRTQSSFGCPNVHLYSGSTPAYTGYNDNRYAIYHSITPGNSTWSIVQINYAHRNLFLGQRVYVVSVPFFQYYCNTDVNDSTYGRRTWMQMFDGWITDTSWTTVNEGNWLGTANKLRSSGFFVSNFGTNLADWRENRYSAVAGESNWWLWPYRQKMVWRSSYVPWANGHVYGMNIGLKYGFFEPCDIDIDAKWATIFGDISFGGSYYTKLVVMWYD